MKRRTVMQNLSYSLFSNVVTTILSVLIILVLPKIISIEEYGYWQLYLFYTSYVGIFHLGWVDGIYLRYGGKELENINQSTLKKQIILFFSLETFLVVIMTFFVLFFYNVDTIEIALFSISNILFLNFKSLIMYTLQSVNKIKEYAVMVTSDRLLFLLVFILLVTTNNLSIRYLILTDIFAKILSSIIGMYYLKPIFEGKIHFGIEDIFEVRENINAGFKLLMSYLCSIFIVGVARLNIVSVWGIETFAKISLTLSISNFLMILINAIGVVVYPMIRKLDEEVLPSIYVGVRDILMAILLILLLSYYPLNIILSYWIPEYSESIMYMAILFPICLYEGKMYLLVNTYLKCLRKEKILMKINIFSLILSVILSYLSTQIIGSLNLAVVSILLVLGFRCVVSEIYVLKFLNIKSFLDIFIELLLTIIFILTSWYLNPITGMGVYLFVMVIYLILKKTKLIKSFSLVRELMRKRI
ncbi:oligosaccharide flippase family protein [Vagococcus fluvialis]|uniref:oligosaccharide flippase family protein n=1 Tax=Vagococcus fluvialis TaxID=2738 RepID=UPI001A8D3FA8|nr:oligosaccharide flippase family protein [Vagococcus fluvialis]MBO0479513.1 oligosaccharide flippase family protein [Vagococcus fluvialis]MBO0484849.1 oligosaccharide flippase family protein [Vagococcus fluvialis]